MQKGRQGYSHWHLDSHYASYQSILMFVRASPIDHPDVLLCSSPAASVRGNAPDRVAADDRSLPHMDRANQAGLGLLDVQHAQHIGRDHKTWRSSPAEYTKRRR